MRAVFSLILVGLLFTPVLAQQQADPDFDTTVAKPAYKKNGPPTQSRK
jgi:hypothetical protein